MSRREKANTLKEQALWVGALTGKGGALLVLSVVLGAVACVFGSGLMFTSGYMISLAATLPATVLALHIPSIFVRIFGIGKPLIDYVERLLSHDWVFRLTSALRRYLYTALDALGSQAGFKRSFGHVLSDLTEDIGHMQNFFLRTVIPVAVAYVVFALVLVASGCLSWVLALGLFILLSASLIAAPLIALACTAHLIDERKRLTEHLYTYLTDRMMGVKDIALSGSIDATIAGALDIKRAIFKLTRRIEQASRQRTCLLSASFALTVIFVFMWAAVSFSSADSSQVSLLAAANSGLVDSLASVVPPDGVVYAANWIAAVSICLFPLFEVFSGVADAIVASTRERSSVDSLRALDEEAKRVRASAAPTHIEASAREAESDVCACPISIHNATFSYPDSSTGALTGVDLEVARAEKIVIVGRSGSGKSTLADVIQGIAVPQTGSVDIVGSIGYVSQNPYLFPMSIKENLLLAKSTADDTEIISALRAVGLGYLTRERTHGINTLVGEDGIDLSGGERQRIALARILLQHHDILVLDEPFIALDAENEQGILDVLLDVFADTTIVLITHHLIDVDRFDRICFMDDGAITLSGTASELREQSAFFRELVALH